MKTRQRKALSLLLALTLMISAVPLGTITAGAATSGDFEYSVLSEEGKICEITKYKGTATELEIPSQLDSYTVTGIGREAFRDCVSLESVIIPNSVTEIGVSAFLDCTSLKSIIIPDSVTDIHSNAFTRCSSLTSIVIPDSVTEICSYVFWDCILLESVTLGNKTVDIGDRAFYRCSSLTSITIPDGVTTVGECAFYGCSSLESIIIPDSVTEIYREAFGDTAYYNTESNWENDVLYIGNHLIRAKDTVSGECTVKDGTKVIAGFAFEDCASLKDITLPDSVTVLGTNAFRKCTSLESIIIPDGVAEITVNLFHKCSSLKNITIPDSVREIGLGAFYYCDSLTNVTVPDGVTEIDQYVFCGCSSLERIIIPDGVTSIGQQAFAVCNSLESVTIPDSVTYIGEAAFAGCSLLTDITIPNSVTAIEGRAFENCASLESIIIPKSVTSIGKFVFEDCNNLTIYGYKGSYAEIYASEANIPFVALTDPSIVQLNKMQIRFRRVGADKDFSSYENLFDVRTVAKISQEDFRNTFGSDEEAIENISDIGFIYADKMNVQTFNTETAKAVAEGTGSDENYIKKQVNYIQHTGDGADYIFTCIIKDIPDADRERIGFCYAYVCYNGVYCYFDDVAEINFNELYTAHKPQA